MVKIPKQTPVKRRFFKDSSSVKTFISDLVHRYENGQLKDNQFRCLISAANVLLRVHVHLYYESKLGDLPEQIETLREEIKTIKGKV